MRINSDANIKLASRVFNAFGGSWQNVRKASVQDANGVWCISYKALEEAERKNERALKDSLKTIVNSCE